MTSYVKINAVHLHRLAVHGVILGLEGEVIQDHLLPVPLHHQVHGLPGGGAELGGQVGVDKNPVAVHRDNPVPRLESLRPGAGEAVHEVPDHRHHIATGGAEQDGHQHKAGNEVHHRPRGQNDELPPGGFVGKGAGVVVLLILPLHGAVAPDGKGPEGILGLPPLEGDQGGTHANGKLIDLDPQELGGEEVSSLVDRDEQAEEEDADDDIDKQIVHLRDRLAPWGALWFFLGAVGTGRNFGFPAGAPFLWRNGGKSTRGCAPGPRGGKSFFPPHPFSLDCCRSGVGFLSAYLACGLQDQRLMARPPARAGGRSGLLTGGESGKPNGSSLPSPKGYLSTFPARPAGGRAVTGLSLGGPQAR